MSQQLEEEFGWLRYVKNRVESSECLVQLRNFLCSFLLRALSYLAAFLISSAHDSSLSWLFCVLECVKKDPTSNVSSYGGDHARLSQQPVFWEKFDKECCDLSGLWFISFTRF